MSYAMNEKMWEGIDNFSYKNFGCIDMDGILIYTLQQMRNYVNRPIIIHCGYEPRATGYHPKKCAVDLHIKGIHVVNQFLIASRFDNFNGIGVYPNWNRPGLHLDTRPKNKKFDSDSRWGCLEPGKYECLDRAFFREVI